jgi:C4-dicarboxylate-specific signal transduction histidine kinase
LDVTEKRHHEGLLADQQKQLKEINSSLESRIEKTVAELRNRDNILIQQSRLTAMGEMISSIAHQWRQPLNNIGLIVQSLQLAFKSNDLSIEELDEDIADVMKVLQQISETIDDFRNFFSYEEEASPFLINERITRALSFVEPSFKSKGIRIELDEEPDVTAVGYPNEYVQAVLNILLNARDALLDQQVPQSLIRIRIFRENGRSVVTVRDNGGGIPEDVLPKIFDPYFTTKQQGKGTGIGLYMAKMIVEKKMHGSLTAYNVDGGVELRIEV